MRNPSSKPRLGRRLRRRRDRRGNILVLSALFMVVAFAMLAFCVDLGYVIMVRGQLQRTADAAAMGAAWQLIDEKVQGGADPGSMLDRAKSSASHYAGLNTVARSGPTLALGDVDLGFLANPNDPAAQMNYLHPNLYNTAHVYVRRVNGNNGEVPLYFARLLGSRTDAAQAEATAAVLNNFSGFRIPSSGQNLGILPFALDKQTWDALMSGTGTDDYKYNPETGNVTSGSDGILEVNLYPQGTGAPGNRGTVDIGSSNNSTSDIARQITDGITAKDLSYLGGKLEFNSAGELYLNGDTGISAGVKDELASIVGKPRIIPIFSKVVGPGNNATYTIVLFVGIRIMDVKLTGSMSSKHVTIQPAKVLIEGGIPGGTTQKTSYIYSPVWLVR